MQLGSRVPAKCLSFFSSCSDKSNFRETQLLAHSSFHCHHSSRESQVGSRTLKQLLTSHFQLKSRQQQTRISLNSLYVYSTESLRMTPPTVGRSSQLDKCNQIISHGCAQRPISSLESSNDTSQPCKALDLLPSATPQYTTTAIPVDSLPKHRTKMLSPETS